MKNEIEEIIDNWIGLNTKLSQGIVADKILSLFINLLDSCEDRLGTFLVSNAYNYDAKFKAKRILQIITSKLEA